MRVLLVNAVCGKGSTGRICTDIYDMLKQHGHEAEVAYAHGEATRINISDTFRINDVKGYYIHNLLARISDRAGFYSKKATKRFIRFIDEYKPDIIHLHNLHGFYINIRILFDYLSQSNIKVVWTLHDCWAFTGHCAHYSFAKCNKWLTECNNCTLKHDYPQSFFIDHSRRNYRDKCKLFTSLPQLTLTTPSEWLAGEVRKSYLKKYPVFPIYNGIDLDSFQPVESSVRQMLKIEPDKKMLLAVAYDWSERKGLDDLLRLNQVMDKRIYQLVIVGLSKKQIECLPDDIIKLPRTESLDDLVKLYSAADIFVNTSYEETMGMVTAEALACGTPAIVYDQTAVPEVIDSNSGIVVRAGDISGILTALSNVKSIDKKACRVRAQTFEKNRQYGKYYQLYLNVLGK